MDYKFLIISFFMFLQLLYPYAAEHVNRFSLAPSAHLLDVSQIAENREIEVLINEYGLGELISYQKVGGGYKNYGYKVLTNQGSYFVKGVRIDDIHLKELAELERQVNHSVNQLAEQKGYDFRIPYLHLTEEEKPYFITQEGKGFMVYEFVEGAFANWGEPRGKRIKTTARMMAQLHSILMNGSISIPDFRASRNSYHDLFSRDKRFTLLQQRLLEDGVDTEVSRKFLDQVQRFIGAIKKLKEIFPPSKYEQLPKQVVHYDLAPIHIQYKRDIPVLVIDWGDVNFDTRAIDFVKGLDNFHDINTYSNLIDLVAHYQLAIDDISDGNRLDDLTIQFLPYVHALHRASLSFGILKKDLSDEDLNLDWQISQMEVFSNLMDIDFSDFPDKVEQRMREINETPEREIQNKNAPSQNVISLIKMQGAGSSNEKDSPIESSLSDHGWDIKLKISLGDYNFSWAVLSKPLDADGYASLKIETNIRHILKKEIANQNASFKLELKFEGNTIFVGRTSDIDGRNVSIDIPNDLGMIDTIVLVAEGTQSAIREIDLEVKNIYFSPKLEWNKSIQYAA